MPIPPQLIATVLGAAIGAGKTALDKKKRKDPMAWVTNTLGGAAVGSAGSAALGGLRGGIAGSFGIPMPGDIGDGEFSGAPPTTPTMPKGGPVLFGRVEKGGLSPKAQVAVDLLKAYISRPRAPHIPMQFPGINAAPPLQVNYAMPQVMPQMQVSDFEPLMYRQRRHYG